MRGVGFFPVGGTVSGGVFNVGLPLQGCDIGIERTERIDIFAEWTHCRPGLDVWTPTNLHNNVNVASRSIEALNTDVGFKVGLVSHVAGNGWRQ